MSRCFPFPPPGYEKKARVDGTDLLTKEKHKEKKQKKDKKDKERKEGKEKKDKDRSKEKHRERKDQKEKHKDKGKNRDKEKNRTSDEKRVEGKPGFYIGEKSGSNSLQTNEIKDSKYVQELARRIRDEDRACGSQMVPRIVAADQRAEIQGVAVESNVGFHSEGKKKVKDTNYDPRNSNGQRNHVDTRGLEKAFGQNLSGVDQERDEGIIKLVEKKDIEKQMDGKEKSKHKEGESRGDKHKDRDRYREKNRKSKDKDRDKEKKKEEKRKEITESGKEQPKIKESGPKLKESCKDSLDFRNIKPLDPLRLSSICSAGEGNLGKRKELEINGFLLDNGNRPNKFQRPLSSSYLVLENGRKLEMSQSNVQLASEKQVPVNNHRVDIKEQKINGLIAAQPPSVSPMRPLPANVPAKENREESAKPPHPDLKYLSQILSVPKMEEWPEFDDQDWLFSSNHLQSKKPSGVDETCQVWAEALRIASADISALPYVIPY